MKSCYINEVEQDGVKLDEQEARLLIRLVGKLSRDALLERGFTKEEAEIIESWYYV